MADESRRQERRSDATLEEFASTALRTRWGGRVKIHRTATVHVALEMSNDEVQELRVWLEDCRAAGGEERYEESGQRIPLPETIVRLIKAVTE